MEVNDTWPGWNILKVVTVCVYWWWWICYVSAMAVVFLSLFEIMEKWNTKRTEVSISGPQEKMSIVKLNPLTLTYLWILLCVGHWLICRDVGGICLQIACSLMGWGDIFIQTESFSMFHRRQGFLVPLQIVYFLWFCSAVITKYTCCFYPFLVFSLFCIWWLFNMGKLTRG